jgi:hypothetical protein
MNQGTNGVPFNEKTEGRKSRDTLPLTKNPIIEITDKKVPQGHTPPNVYEKTCFCFMLGWKRASLPVYDL